LCRSTENLVSLERRLDGHRSTATPPEGTGTRLLRSTSAIIARSLHLGPRARD